MIHRFDKLAISLPTPNGPDANAAAAVQELLGGKFGEMSTLMNYTFQSFNFRGRSKQRPFFDLISNIAGEEYSHIELVSATINLLLSGTTQRADRSATIPPGAVPVAGEEAVASAKARAAATATKKSKPTDDPSPLDPAIAARNSYHFLASGQGSLPMDSMGQFWTGQNVFSSGNLKLDLLHNFFLECGARAGKIRVYEMVKDPTARAMVGFLLVRGGVHIVAYAKALELLTGANVGALLPIPDVSNKQFPEAMKHEAAGIHRIMYRFSPNDYPEIGKIWKGPHPEDGLELEVRDEMPEGAPWPEFDEEPQLGAPGGIDPEMLKFYAAKLK